MPNRLAYDLVAATVVAFRAARATHKGDRSFLKEGLSELKVTLSTVAEFLHGLSRAQSAFPFDEHG